MFGIGPTLEGLDGTERRSPLKGFDMARATPFKRLSSSAIPAEGSRLVALSCRISIVSFKNGLSMGGGGLSIGGFGLIVMLCGVNFIIIIKTWPGKNSKGLPVGVIEFVGLVVFPT